MLYKFKSKNTGDVIMLQPNGRRVLQIIGKDVPEDIDTTGEKGIILPEQMPAAIAALEAAIAREEADQKAALAEALAHNEPAPHFESVSLRQRAQPFIEMLKRCQEDGSEVVWGV
ncbi:DUF1840 domain-containing protein [Rhodoferax ferrireducens]|uniref:DUF1840 domain-containing protein n=1 Tax=Rhodoferax ferrireducens TaxID=192843 RepID=UPI003BB4CE9F